MQVAAASLRRASGVYRAPLLLLQHVSSHPSSSSHFKYFRTSSLQNGIGSSNGGLLMPSDLWHRNHQCCMLLTAPFCTAPAPASAPSDSVKDVYDKIVESIKVKKSAPPNAWLWSLIEGCNKRVDVKLLFSILKQLRIFRLSNLRVSDNFNCNLCHEVTKACVRSGAVDYGKRTLWRHNVYGLTPTPGSANQLLSIGGHGCGEEKGVMVGIGTGDGGEGRAVGCSSGGGPGSVVVEAPPIFGEGGCSGGNGEGGCSGASGVGGVTDCGSGEGEMSGLCRRR